MTRRLKTAIALLLPVFLALSLFSCKKEPHFGHAELSIKLNERFTEYDSKGAYDVAYSYGGIIVGILRLSHEACLNDPVPVPTTLSPNEFASYYRTRAGAIDGVGEVENYGDIPYFTYNLSGDDKRLYTYMPTFYAGQNAYFVVTFITLEADYAELYDDICYYLDTVRLQVA